ncbi:transmembrane protein 134 isoform X11 [Eptesicus fuscus]|uniref:transmembrane protein 134 isoform X11 n=1 Tax=Eptesicus fuscus TaxID=29078 RepID=UPI00240402C6|nr:transmembrane protein 134 isoform X11 [Eptesicus fuscus]
MSAARPQFSIDDAFELSLEDAGPGPESSGVARFGPLHFERRARFEAADEDKQSRLRYQNLENDEEGAQVSPEPDGGVNTRDSGRTSSVRSSQWSFSTISNSTQRSYNACCSWTQHPLIQKNRRVVLASFLLLLLGLGAGQVYLAHLSEVTRQGRVLILVGVGLEVAPSPVYHVIFIYCAVKGHRGFQFFYLPYFEK